ncbi:MAG: Asp-tRNA(Asn)/Glu-tRNA(Gln) amidotransferase subunit GatC [Patescibacteria group bacterium]
MQLTKDDIDKLAALAKIRLTEDEERVFGEQLSSILDYAQQVDDVDTSGVEFSSAIDYPTGPLRTDEPTSPAGQSASTSQFPESTGNLNKVKTILE